MQHTRHTLLGYLRSGRPIFSNGMGGEGDITTHPALLAKLNDRICDDIGGYKDIGKNRPKIMAIVDRLYEGLTAQDQEDMADAFDGWLARDNVRQCDEHDAPDDRWNDFVCARNFHAMAAHYLGGRQIEEGGDHF